MFIGVYLSFCVAASEGRLVSTGVWLPGTLGASLLRSIGHSLGRVGCFFAGCCYGKPTDSWLGVKFPAAARAGIPDSAL